MVYDFLWNCAVARWPPALLLDAWQQRSAASADVARRELVYALVMCGFNATEHAECALYLLAHSGVRLNDVEQASVLNAALSGDVCTLTVTLLWLWGGATDAGAWNAAQRLLSNDISCTRVLAHRPPFGAHGGSDKSNAEMTARRLLYHMCVAVRPAGWTLPVAAQDDWRAQQLRQCGAAPCVTSSPSDTVHAAYGADLAQALRAAAVVDTAVRVALHWSAAERQLDELQQHVEAEQRRQAESIKAIKMAEAAAAAAAKEAKRTAKVEEAKRAEEAAKEAKRAEEAAKEAKRAEEEAKAKEATRVEEAERKAAARKLAAAEAERSAARAAERAEEAKRVEEEAKETKRVEVAAAAAKEATRVEEVERKAAARKMAAAEAARAAKRKADRLAVRAQERATEARSETMWLQEPEEREAAAAAYPVAARYSRRERKQVRRFELCRTCASYDGCSCA